MKTKDIIYKIQKRRPNITPRALLLIGMLLLSTGIDSCKKFLDIPLPKTRLVSGNVFSDDATATAAVVGIYSDMMQTFKFISLNETLYTGLAADEFSYPSAVTPTWVQFANDAVLPDNTEVNNCWSQAYVYIYDANAAIAGLENTTGVSPSVKNQLLGEAKFIRAFDYFFLVNLFGDVPLVLSTDYEENTVMPRTPVADVYKQIINDLKDAQGLLSTTYATPERVRPNKWTATALLAKAYLYTKDYKNAAEQASAIINSGTYTLAPVTDVFLKTSNETIWQLMPVNSRYNTLIAGRIVPANNTIVPFILLTNDLVNSFEPNDQRKTNWVGTSVISGVTYYYFYKYKLTTGTPLNEYFIVFRLAEQYLIRAEAEMQLNDNADAIADLNMVRTRAGITPLPSTLTAVQITAAIEKERRVELFAEWGNRWFDLKRTNRIDAVMSAYKPGMWKSTSALWPIPLVQINANQKLTQNPGY